jgi:hypothetical protein
MQKLKPWHEWNVPSPWVFAVGGLVLVGISTIVFWQISESLSGSIRQAAPAAPAAAPRNPNDPDSF